MRKVNRIIQTPRYVKNVRGRRLKLLYFIYGCTLDSEDLTNHSRLNDNS